MTRFLPALGIMVIIFLLSHTPGDDLPSQIDGLDKLCHATAYGVLAATVIFAMLPWSRHQEGRMAFGILIFCLLYGLSDEFHQSFIPGRFPSGMDIVADGLGAALVLIAWRVQIAVKHDKNH